MKHILKYILIISAVALYSCEDYYVPEIEQFPDAIVIEGMITDQEDYVTIQVNRSASFNKSSYFFSEKNATVTVESGWGWSYPAREISRGVYQTTEKIKTTPSEEFRVRVITSKGEKYRSEWEKMPPKCPIDSIYLKDTIFRDINLDYWGQPVARDYDGINFSIIPHEPEDENVGFLYKWNALSNYYVLSSTGPSEFNYYCWKRMKSNQFYVYDYDRDDYISELPLSDIHFLSYYAFSPFPVDSSRFTPEFDPPLLVPATVKNIYISSFYYQLRQYVISKKASTFWQGIKNQSEASGKLFDPIEEQIYGNIYCEDDSTKKAFGYFTTASYSSKIISGKIGSDYFDKVKIVDLMPVVTEEEDCFLGEIPDFWY
ncbi:MAG: DUF4249 domain-containing protein [Prolixibacteraceae bacterium]|nr:DUF4249 domain-containing protein [Prolixibacteraceae bacterium]